MTPRQLDAIGRAMHGSRWQAALSADLKLATKTIQRWLSGESPIRESLPAELIAVCEARREHLRDVIADLKDIKRRQAG